MEAALVEKLSSKNRETALASLPEWKFDEAGGTISRSFGFEDFSEAFAFMTRVALLAEKAGHHPDWSNSFDTVDISLSTHDAGGLSQKDIDLAGKIDALLK